MCVIWWILTLCFAANLCICELSLDKNKQAYAEL